MSMVEERNSLRGRKLETFKKLGTFGSFSADYVKGLIAVAIKHGEVNLYTGEKIVVKKFLSRNDAQWDLKYGTTDLSIEMKHRFKHMTVSIDPSFKQNYLERNKVKRLA